MKNIGKSVVAFLLGTLLTLPVGATIINLEAFMDCLQANAGLGTCAAGGSGTGTAAVTFDDTTSILSWDISWSGLSGTTTVAHFHGPAAPGVNAGVQVPLIGSPPDNPNIGSAMITMAQATDLLAGLWYVNVHSDAFTGGEIRGQVNVAAAPEPATLLIFLMGLVGLGALRLRKG